MKDSPTGNHRKCHFIYEENACVCVCVCGGVCELRHIILRSLQVFHIAGINLSADNKKKKKTKYMVCIGKLAAC